MSEALYVPNASALGAAAVDQGLGRDGRPPTQKLTINRAPVLTPWAAVVAERLGFERPEALTLGRAVAGLAAQSKGRRLGIFTPSPAAVRRKRAEEAKGAGVFRVALRGREAHAGPRQARRARAQVAPVGDRREHRDPWGAAVLAAGHETQARVPEKLNAPNGVLYVPDIESPSIAPSKARFRRPTGVSA